MRRNRKPSRRSLLFFCLGNRPCSSSVLVRLASQRAASHSRCNRCPGKCCNKPPVGKPELKGHNHQISKAASNMGQVSGRYEARPFEEPSWHLLTLRRPSSSISHVWFGLPSFNAPLPQTCQRACASSRASAQARTPPTSARSRSKSTKDSCNLRDRASGLTELIGVGAVVSARYGPHALVASTFFRRRSQRKEPKHDKLDYQVRAYFSATQGNLLWPVTAPIYHQSPEPRRRMCQTEPPTPAWS